MNIILRHEMQPLPSNNSFEKAFFLSETTTGNKILCKRENLIIPSIKPYFTQKRGEGLSFIFKRINRIDRNQRLI
mgnify:CR=1 FL=1